MNYEQLSLLVKEEENNGDLTPFPPHMYCDIASFIKDVQNELKDTDPDAPSHSMLKDELKTVERFKDKILLRRVSKILDLAGRSVLNGLSVDITSMVTEEYNMFNDAVKDVERLKTELLCVGEVGIDQGEYTLIRAVEDINTFSGPDGREYDLQKDDVATIPGTIANVLIGRHVAVLA